MGSLECILHITGDKRLVVKPLVVNYSPFTMNEKSVWYVFSGTFKKLEILRCIGFTWFIKKMKNSKYINS